MAAAKQIYATGRRKTSTARVFLSQLDSEVENNDDVVAGDASIVVNGKAFSAYFPNETTRQLVLQPLVVSERLDQKYKLKVTVKGGGKSGQAGAVRHGIARVLEKVEEELRPSLKKQGLLTRDPRAVERKKAGRHKARKGTQFSKR